MAEKKVTTKAAATKATATKAAATTKKATITKRVCAAKTAVKVSISAENVGFRAGDVYQALASAEKALTVKEIAKAANITETEVLLGAGWLLKEGKIKGENDVIALA